MRADKLFIYETVFVSRDGIEHITRYTTREEMDRALACALDDDTMVYVSSEVSEVNHWFKD